jgi:hypothetical protein
LILYLHPDLLFLLVFLCASSHVLELCWIKCTLPWYADIIWLKCDAFP